MRGGPAGAAQLTGLPAHSRLSGDGLACIRGGLEVFSGLSLAVEAGRALVVTGRNGAGKTTLLRLLAGLLRPSAGSLTLTGGDPDASLAEQAHYLGHQDALKSALTVAENLGFWATYLNDSAAGNRIGNPMNNGDSPGGNDALAVWGLQSLRNTPAAYLSAGQRRRLSLCRLIAVPRPVWLLDEPTAALDAGGQDILGALMQRHLADGGIIVAATHGPLPLDGAAELDLGQRQ
jgi:heme exporter protein A